MEKQKSSMSLQPLNSHIEMTKIEEYSKMFEKDLRVKEQELLLKKDELELRKQSERHAYTYSMEMLKVKKEDRTEYIRHLTLAKRNFYIFMIVTLSVIVFLIYSSIVNNKDELAKDLIRALIYIIIALGGYYCGKNINFKKDDNLEK